MATRKSTKKLKPSFDDLLRWRLRKLALDGLMRKLDPQSLRLDRKLLKSMLLEQYMDIKKFKLTIRQLDRLADKELAFRKRR